MKDERYRYPEKFKTKREMLWYIKGLMDSKMFFEMGINTKIERYRDKYSFYRI